MAVTTIVGVISDTHGLLRLEAIDALRGSDLILHAGDVGSREVLVRLTAIAPTIAVRGNVDRDASFGDIPECVAVEIGKLHVYMLHDLATLDLKPEAAGFAAVVFGHSHQPTEYVKDGVLYFNPGSAGPRRFHLPIAVGRLIVEPQGVRSESILLG